ncbi:non-ribosomal peptide synthetase [Sphingomonas desiccabilis]|uniref:Amino acid adenylation domain-containing protein n=1 Tax=Sphingomonas desiccabilis TaxID=429134 RepID=A0A4Q2IP77_9SPHN|nr:non-ribosomal peptide synthetase [Sphingomonas desiccabilis]MBB3911829.1 amino acid adenylation domain-containing protein [Sphingomonas desiccabilis]RXZ31456.1 amino acid adenylation domain-containing protein [Sphingomonas desiccabilis]
MATVIQDRPQVQPRRTRTPAIPPRAPDAVTPMTEEQRHVWLHAARCPGAPLYNEPFTIIRKGPFELQAFREAFDEVVRRHEAWRATFEERDGEPVQHIHAAMPSELAYVDLTGISRMEDREREALALAEADAWKPFDLAQGPLFRGRVAKLADEDHRLYLVLHHLIFDGVSINRVMMPELAAILAANMEGRPHDLPPPTAQYGDYAVWQREGALQRSRDVQTNYWRRILGDDPPILQLPTDRPHSANPRPNGAMETLDVSPELRASLQDLSRANGVTLYMTVLATFCTLLHRYSGQEDLIVGGVADTRRRPETQRMMGYCINSMALRSRPAADMPFHDYLHQIRDVVIGAIENSEVPFGHVVQTLGVRSESGIAPVFQVMFTLDPPRSRELEGWDLVALEVPPRTAKYDLYAEITDTGAGLRVRILYATDLFEAETVAAMAKHWERLMRAVAEAPGTPLIDLPMMDAGEAAAMLALAQGQARAIPPRTLPDHARKAARSRPSHPAVRCAGTRWTHEELWQRVDALAMHLRLAGIGRGDLVAVCMTRSADTVAAPLAIMQAGAAYLPLDPSFPASRLDAIVADAAPAMVITNRAGAGILPGWGVPVLACDDLPAIHPASARGTTVVPPDPADLAYVIYTSGSTGVPKGVEIAHRAVVNLLESMRREPGFGAEDVMFAVTTPTFDISILELFLPLIAGGTVVVASSAESRDPMLQADAIARSGCTVMQGTPATWRALFSTGWSGRPGLKILCGGEALPRDLADRILAGGMSLWNMYGPTETTVWSSIEAVGPDRITIGRPIDNTRMLVLDDAGRPQPPNVGGHLLIGGEGLARGYRDPALTARAFTPLAMLGGDRFYRTGDMALIRRDGRCEWLGRRDGQVKIRGYRIDLGDVESALASHPKVAAAAVKTFDNAGHAGLAAFYVPRGPKAPDAAMLRDHLRQLLPSYMIPAQFAAIAKMPLSTSGKVDRKALPAVEVQAREHGLHEAPHGDIELRLAVIWSDILSVPDIGVTDDFQELGGHSLLAARMMGRIAAEFGQRLPISTLLRAPTIRTMAALIEKGEIPGGIPDTVKIQDGIGPPLFWIDAVPNLRPGYYRAMASAVGSGQPIIGLPIDLDRFDGLRGDVTVLDIARDVATRIQAHPSGPPYMIGGWCNGGILAYAVAAELERRDAEVSLLVLLDTANPARYRTAAARMRHQVAQLATLPIGCKMPFAVETIRGYASRFRRRHIPARTETAELLDLNDRFMRIVKNYEPVPFAGRMALFQPREGKIDYAPGWRGLVADLRAEDVPGGHVSVLDPPHVATLGRRIAAHIRRVQRSTADAARA